MRDEGFSLSLQSHVALGFELHLLKGCCLDLLPKTKVYKRADDTVFVKYKKNKKVKLDVRCSI
jgi:hypothetical protein